MKLRAYLAIERIICTCWITNRDWSWKVAFWPGREDDGWLRHSLGSAAYKFESAILCGRFMEWLCE